MEKLLDQLRTRFPALTFREGSTFCWSPKSKEIIYALSSSSDTAVWSLLHETSHALLSHTSYKTDFQLLSLELEAWERAKELAYDFAMEINEDHIQDCLDSYRDWIYARSVCPECGNKSLQQANLKQYKCFNCHAVWHVTPSRFCRAYRATKSAATTFYPFDAMIKL